MGEGKGGGGQEGLPPTLILPRKRLCRNIILRHQPKLVLSKSEGTLEILHCVQDDTLCQILHFVQNDRHSVSSYYDTVSKGGGGFECFFHSSPSSPLLERAILILSLPV